MKLKEISETWFIISEAMRVEGHIMKERNMQGMAISNKDLNILSKVESAYKFLYPSRKTSKMLVIMVYLSKKVNVQKIINKTNKKELKFHIDKHNRLYFIQGLDTFNINLNYAIITKNKKYNLNVNINKENTIKTNSLLQSTAYATLQIYNAPFARYLAKRFKIPVGIGQRKSYEIDFPFAINKLLENQIKTILNIVICCEGCVFYNKNKGDRVLKIKLASDFYLKKLKLMFNKIGIKCQEIRPTSDGLFVLDIRKRKNFDILYNKICLISKRKQNILKKIISSYSSKRFTHYQATEKYLSTLKKYGPNSSLKIATVVDRKRDTVWIALERLAKKGYVTKFGREYTGKGTTPWIYQINKKGINYLNNQL